MATGSPAAVRQLVDRADALYLRAPELAVVLGERAAALAEAAGSDELWVRAESLVVSAKVRIGDRPATVGRAVAALRAAEDAGYSAIAARLRIDLAVCARSVGAPLTALAALRPVLADPDLDGAVRAAALCHLVGCMAQFGRKSELDRVLVEADKLCSADDSMDADTRLLLRALLRVGTSAHRRRHGDLTAAADAARMGLGFLDRLDKPDDDGGLVRVRLILQLACTLLDRGDTEMALEISQPVLDAPIRAAGVGPAGWLRFAIATRVHLPGGSGDTATMMLREAVHSTDQHGLHALTAKLWLELAQLEERLGRPGDAIECLHRSRAAEHVHARARRQAFGLLSGTFGAEQQAPVDLDEVLAVKVKRAAPARVRWAEREMPEILPVPELQLAPAPAAEPAPRVALVSGPPPSSSPVPRVPEPALPRRETQGRENRSRNVPAAPTTRHDSDHGSVAARSVLDRLGISSGDGGGRRRATEESVAEAPVEPVKTGPVQVESPAQPPETASWLLAAVEPPQPPVHEEPSARTERLTDEEYGDQVADPWLPRLRMPPPLEPVDDQGPGWSTSDTHGGSTADFGAPFADSYARAIAEDEPSPDAGLAELLARALAEHQAGTASAAALVKGLGTQRHEPGERRPVNGHGRPGESPDNGRHRTGD
jgi:hypothetical protein